MHIGCSCAIYFLCFYDTGHQKVGIIASAVFFGFAAFLFAVVAFSFREDDVVYCHNPVGLKAFATAVCQILAIIINILLSVFFGYWVYRLNPQMQFSMQVHIINMQVPFDVLLLMFSPLINMCRLALVRKSNDLKASVATAFIAGFLEYLHIRLLTLFFYLCAPLLKDFRCEIVQEQGRVELKYCARI